ncbi:MAG TPA: NAD(P)H-dependent oxidoreductase, partial [Hyphomicrobiales bacterium]
MRIGNIRKEESALSTILIIQGHPDPAGDHLCHALADAYAQGAVGAGHSVSRVDVAAIDFPLLRTKAEFETGRLPES